MLNDRSLVGYKTFVPYAHKLDCRLAEVFHIEQAKLPFAMLVPSA